MLWQKNSRGFLEKTGFCLKPTFLLQARPALWGQRPAPFLKAAPGAESKFQWDFVLVHQKLPKRGEMVSSPGPDTCCFYLLTVSGKTGEATRAVPRSGELQKRGLLLLCLGRDANGGHPAVQVPCCISQRRANIPTAVKKPTQNSTAKLTDLSKSELLMDTAFIP